MTVGSLFAGVGGFDLGFERAGFTVRWQAESDPAAQKVLRHQFPGVRLYDDVRAITADTAERVDVICGGFPCQDVSVAGKREGLAGSRTGLFWEVVRIARELQPSWMVLENVPGLLTSHSGRDFHTVLSALAECGFRREYRILDSRYFRVAQRRSRVFLVLRARDAGDSAVQVLFEPTRGGGHPAAGAEAGARVAATPRGRSHGASVNADAAYTLRDNGRNTSQGPGNDVAACLTEQIDSSDRNGGPPNLLTFEPGEHLVAATLETTCGDYSRSDGFTMVGVPAREHPLVGSMFKRHDDDTDTLIPTLSASLGHHGHSSPRGDGCDPLVAVPLQYGEALGGTKDQNGDGIGHDGDPMYTLECRQPHGVAVALRANPSAGQAHNTTYPGGVRRLTPLECERLQGFPDGWSCLCGEGHKGSSFCSCPDSPRYKQMGNAVTVNVAAWIARRLRAASHTEAVA